MKLFRFFTFAIFLTLMLVPAPIQAQDANETTTEVSDDLTDPTSSAFQAELRDLQIANPHLGPDHDLVYPGNVLVFADGTRHVIREGEYESMLLLEYLQQQGLDSGQLVTIVRQSDPPIMIQQAATGDMWPWYMVLLAVLATLALLAMAWALLGMSDGSRSIFVSTTTTTENEPTAQDPVENEPVGDDGLRDDPELVDANTRTSVTPQGSLVNVPGNGNTVEVSIDLSYHPDHGENNHFGADATATTRRERVNGDRPEPVE